MYSPVKNNLHKVLHRNARMHTHTRTHPHKFLSKNNLHKVLHRNARMHAHTRTHPHKFLSKNNLHKVLYGNACTHSHMHARTHPHTHTQMTVKFRVTRNGCTRPGRRGPTLHGAQRHPNLNFCFYSTSFSNILTTSQKSS